MADREFFLEMGPAHKEEIPREGECALNGPQLCTKMCGKCAEKDRKICGQYAVFQKWAYSYLGMFR